jgi:HAD superfamily hydrolase (TIGR01450 family)
MTQPVRGFMFDVDGTLVLGDRSGAGNYKVLPGADEVLETLKKRAIPFVLLTNGSGYNPPVVAARLRGVGLPVEDAQMLTPSSVAADYMVRKGVKRCLILGTPGVGQPLADAGIEAVHPEHTGDHNVQAVYVGWHPDCNMRDIEAAAQSIWAGAGFYVASDVPFFATQAGRSIGYSHAIVAAVRSLTKKRAIVLGKPSSHAMRFVARKLGVGVKDVGVVGDDPALESAMAVAAGATAFGVATGLTPYEEWIAMPKARRPHHALHAVGGLLENGLIP